MKRIVIAFLAFAFVCACGLFVAAASGITWGTVNCGFLSFMTLLIAGYVGAMILVFGVKS